MPLKYVKRAVAASKEIEFYAAIIGEPRLAILYSQTTVANLLHTR